MLSRLVRLFQFKNVKKNISMNTQSNTLYNYYTTKNFSPIDLKLEKQKLWDEFHTNIGSDHTKNIVKKLQELPQYAQRSQNWYNSRKTRITASEAACVLPLTKEVVQEYENFFDLNIVTNSKKVCNPYQSKKDFLKQKCGLTDFSGNIATRWGQMFEQVATNIYTKLTNKTIIDFGLIEHPEENFIGASPDGISDDGIMLEIKCPFKRKITGIPPLYYWIQMQIQLEVCKLNICDYIECSFDQDFTWKGTLKDFNKLKVCGFDEHSIRNKFNDRFQSDALEKGIILRVNNFGSFENATYYYPDSSLSHNEQIDWSDEMIKKLSSVIDIQRFLRYSKSNLKSKITFNEYKKTQQHYTIKPIFWKLNDIHITTILRSEKWYKTVEKMLKESHKEMMNFKNNKHLLDELLPKKYKIQLKSPSTTTTTTTCVFTETETETEKKEKVEKKKKIPMIKKKKEKKEEEVIGSSKKRITIGKKKQVPKKESVCVFTD